MRLPSTASCLPSSAAAPVAVTASAGSSLAGTGVAPSSMAMRSHAAPVTLPEISPSALSAAFVDDAGVAEVTRADNADPKRVGEYINAIMKHFFELEVSGGGRDGRVWG